MQKNVKAYTVRQLAKLAGVSVRTLHHYDHIGLLKPSMRTDAGYRLYKEKDLLRLQQILFFKELDFPLSEIQDILDDPQFDQTRALASHRKILLERVVRLTRLLSTIDKTILKLEGKMPLTDAELYEGFTPEQVERYQREVNEKYDPKLVAESNRRVRNMSKEQWNAVKNEGQRVTLLLASLADKKPNDAQVQQVIAQHHAHIEQFFPCSAEIYRGLAQMYTDHPEFRAFYDKVRPGLADFMRPAMEYYSDHTLSK